MESDGKVKKAFKVDGQQYRTEGGNKKAKKGKKGRKSISNLNHLLLLTRRVVSPDTNIVLSAFFRVHSPSQIFNWRNDSLHGSEDRSTTIIVLYCLISILLLDFLAQSSGDTLSQE